MLTFQDAHYCLMSNFSSTPQVLPCRTALYPLTPHSLQILGIAPTQVQNLEVHTGLLLKPFKVPLPGTPFPQHITCTAHLGVSANLPKAHSSPLSMLVIKILIIINPSTDL